MNAINGTRADDVRRFHVAYSRKLPYIRLKASSRCIARSSFSKLKCVKLHFKRRWIPSRPVYSSYIPTFYNRMLVTAKLLDSTSADPSVYLIIRLIQVNLRLAESATIDFWANDCNGDELRNLQSSAATAIGINAQLSRMHASIANSKPLTRFPRAFRWNQPIYG
jgi:hypothetical protein